jgi:hypothetical protein
VPGWDKRFFVDRFTATDSEQRVVWLSDTATASRGYSHPGEQIDVQPGGWIYRNATVQPVATFSANARQLRVPALCAVTLRQRQHRQLETRRILTATVLIALLGNR